MPVERAVYDSLMYEPQILRLTWKGVPDPSRHTSARIEATMMLWKLWVISLMPSEDIYVRRGFCLAHHFEQLRSSFDEHYRTEYSPRELAELDIEAVAFSIHDLSLTQRAALGARHLIHQVSDCDINSYISVTAQSLCIKSVMDSFVEWWPQGIVGIACPEKVYLHKVSWERHRNESAWTNDHNVWQLLVTRLEGSLFHNWQKTIEGICIREHLQILVDHLPKAKDHGLHEHGINLKGRAEIIARAAIIQNFPRRRAMKGAMTAAITSMAHSLTNMKADL